MVVGNPTHTRFIEGAVIESGSLRHCEGNCNSDDDCGFGLECFHRNGKEPIPGVSLVLLRPLMGTIIA